MTYRITNYNFDPNRFDEMLAYADGVRSDLHKIDGLVSAHVCRSGENEAIIIAHYVDKKSLEAAAPQVAKIMSGLGAFMTTTPKTTVGELIWKSHG